MPANRTSAQPEAAGPTLADLGVSELTAALGASDMPARVRGASREQVAAWAQQGLDRLGANAVREHAERTTYLDYGSVIGTNTPEQGAELRGLWPSVRRLDAATDTAYGLRKHLAAELLGVPESDVGPSARPAVDVLTEAVRLRPAEPTATVDTEAECRVEAAAIFSNPAATQSEFDWAQNWGPEAEADEQEIDPFR